MEFSRNGKRRKRPQRPKPRTKGAYENYIVFSKKINRQEGIIDKSSDTYQRIMWYQLKTSIYILINKVNPINVGTVKKELLKLNILRGKGLFCKFITQAQIASTNDTRVYATLVAVINLVFPEIGKLLLMRCIKRFKTTYYSTNKKYKCLASVIFIAHLINHGVADEMLAIELSALLLGSIQTTVSIESVIVILEICGRKVSEVHKKRIDAILDIIHSISLNEQLHEKIKNKIKWILKLHENGFKAKQLDLVPTDDCQITHFISLHSNIDTSDTIDHYRYDPNYEKNEKKYELLKIESLQESETEDENSFEYTNKYDRKIKMT